MNARRNDLVDSLIGKSRGILTPSDAVNMFGGVDDISSGLKDQLEKLESAGPTASKSDSASKVDTEKQSVLTKEEAFSLQNRIDALSDEQLQKVFEKMRKSLGDKLAGELGSALKQSTSIPKPPVPAQADKRSMPRAETIDPSVRSRYKTELTAIEDELEKIYQNPLSVWQELMTDPDRYLSDEEIKAIDEDKELQ
jgi:hypothetical protein